MPSPKTVRTVKRVTGSTTLRGAAVARVPSAYPKYFVFCVDDKKAEDILREQLKGVPVSTGRLLAESQMVIMSIMSNSNPPC